MHSLFGAPGGIGPLSAREKGRRSSTALDAGMLAKIKLLLLPETMIVSSPSLPYDAGFQTRSLFGAPGGICPLSARGKGRRSFDASDAGVLAKMLSL